MDLFIFLEKILHEQYDPERFSVTRKYSLHSFSLLKLSCELVKVLGLCDEVVALEGRGCSFEDFELIMAYSFIT